MQISVHLLECSLKAVYKFRTAASIKDHFLMNYFFVYMLVTKLVISIFLSKSCGKCPENETPKNWLNFNCFSWPSKRCSFGENQTKLYQLYISRQIKEKSEMHIGCGNEVVCSMKNWN